MEDVYGALRSDILFGRRLPSSRLRSTSSPRHAVSLSVVREAVTRLATEDLVEATPQRGFRVRSISLEHLHDLTGVRIQIETLALRQSIAKGDVTWEANLVAAHHRLAVTPTYFEDGPATRSGWPPCAVPRRARAAAGAPSSNASAGSSTTLPSSTDTGPPPAAPPCRAHVADEHKAIFDAALAREADLAVDLLTRHLEATARNLEAIAADVGTTDARTSMPSSTDRASAAPQAGVKVSNSTRSLEPAAGAVTCRSHR